MIKELETLPLTSVQVWLHGSMQRAGDCLTARSRSESLRRRKREKDTQALFRDNLCFHNTEWQAFTGPKGKQLSAFQHGRLIGLFIRKAHGDSSPCSSWHARGDSGGICLPGEKPHLSEVEKPFGQDTKRITKSDRSGASCRHTWRGGA